MEEYKLYKAKVISIDDPQKKGKIQIQVLPELKDIKTTDGPWAIPFISINSTSIMQNDLPELNSIVRVFIRKDWQRFYYIANAFFENIFNFDTINTKLDTISTINNKEYKNISFRMYKDGSLEFHNNQTQEHGFIQQNGSYQFFDKDGKIFIHAKSNQNIIVEGNEIQLNGTSKKFVTYDELNTAIQTFINSLNLHTHPSNGAPPTTPMSLDISSSQTTTIKTGG